MNFSPVYSGTWSFPSFNPGITHHLLCWKEAYIFFKHSLCDYVWQKFNNWIHSKIFVQESTSAPNRSIHTWWFWAYCGRHISFGDYKHTAAREICCFKAHFCCCEGMGWGLCGLCPGRNVFSSVWSLVICSFGFYLLSAEWILNENEMRSAHIGG